MSVKARARIFFAARAAWVSVIATLLSCNSGLLSAAEERPATEAAAAREMIERAPAAAAEAADNRPATSQPTAAAVAEPTANVELIRQNRRLLRRAYTSRQSSPTRTSQRQR